MRAYLQISGAIFALVTLAHLLRVVLDWPIQVASWVAPMWISWIAIPIVGTLCVWAFRLIPHARR